MESRARAIFRDALVTHYMDGICAAGEEVELWLKAHGGWIPDPEEYYGHGCLMPLVDDPDVMSKEPEKATKEAKGVMSLLAEFLGDGVAELMVRSDLKGLAQKWLDDLEEQAPVAQGRYRSRSPRRCVVPDMTIDVLKATIQLKDATIEVLEGKIRAQDRELVKNAYSISYLEATVKGKEQLIATKDDLHNKVMAGMENLFKKP